MAWKDVGIHIETALASPAHPLFQTPLLLQVPAALCGQPRSYQELDAADRVRHRVRGRGDQEDGDQSDRTEDRAEEPVGTTVSPTIRAPKVPGWCVGSLSRPRVMSWESGKMSIPPK